ncbi:MAG: SPOR domain-containing protein [Deltaproteobacteria bacterium]|nr:SPOR domain-containing protein [Deltaproteobacteria bacterium]
MIKRKYVLKLTRRSFTGLTLIIILGAIWMFVLGIFVGRKSVPVTFHMKDIKEVLVSLKEEDAKKGSSAIKESKSSDKREELDFYKFLKENRGEERSKIKLSRNENHKNKVSVSKKDVSPKVSQSDEAKSSNMRDEGGKNFTIQVASVQDEKTASRMVADLKKDGYPAYKMNANIPELGVWFRVRVGPYSSRDKAGSVIEGLKKRKFKPILLKE